MAARDPHLADVLPPKTGGCSEPRCAGYPVAACPHQLRGRRAGKACGRRLCPEHARDVLCPPHRRLRDR